MSDFPFLIRLLDDPNPKIAEKVASQLRALGNEIWSLIEQHKIELTDTQRMTLERLFVRDSTQNLWEEWADLGSETDEIRYLEKALLCLARWQSGPEASVRGTFLLDRLAAEFRAFEEAKDAPTLAEFLFEFCGLHGATPEDYYNPFNSNLTFVLEEGAGLPITLTCVFILVGARIGLQIEGCNFPGHFLARDRRRQTVFDPYNRGRMLSAREVATLRKAAPTEMETRTTAREIVARVLRNLSVAYHHSGQGEYSGLMLSLLRAIDGD